MYSLTKAAVDATFRFCMLNVLIVFYDGEKVDNSSGLSQSTDWTKAWNHLQKKSFAGY